MPYVVQGAERFFERAEVRAGDGRAAGGHAAPRPTARRCARRVVGALRRGRLAPGRAAAGGAARERWEALAALVGLAEEFGDDAGRWPSSPRNWPAGPQAQHAPTVDGRDAGQPALGQGSGVGRRVPGRAGRGRPADTYAKTPDAVEEERRLLYVGITRARQWLMPVLRGGPRPGRPGPPAVPVPAGRQRPARPAPGGRPGDAATPTAPGGGSSRCRAGYAARPCRRRPTASWAGAPPVRPHGRGAVRAVARVALGHGRGAGRAGVRRLHRRHADRAGRAAADATGRTGRDRRDRPAQAGARTATRCSRWSAAPARRTWSRRRRQKKVRQRRRKLVCPRVGRGA